MIPVLICPVINRFDLLEKMLGSIDHPVGRLVIVDNSCSGYEYHGGNDYLPPADYIRPAVTGIGYGGAINQGITQTAGADWWLWSSNDVQFRPGTLSDVVDDMEEVGINTPRICTRGFTWGAVNKALIREVGFIDEWSFFPIYFDDNDYHYRCRLAGVEWVEYDSGASEHGGDGFAGSLAINSDPILRTKNHPTFIENYSRYVDKWGGSVDQEKYDSPWNSGMPVWFTKPDIDGRARRLW